MKKVLDDRSSRTLSPCRYAERLAGLQPRLDQLPDAVVVADGFSCATQVDHLAGSQGVRAVHLAELLDPGEDFTR